MSQSLQHFMEELLTGMEGSPLIYNDNARTPFFLVQYPLDKAASDDSTSCTAQLSAKSSSRWDSMSCPKVDNLPTRPLRSSQPDESLPSPSLTFCSNSDSSQQRIQCLNEPLEKLNFVRSTTTTDTPDNTLTDLCPRPQPLNQSLRMSSDSLAENSSSFKVQISNELACPATRYIFEKKYNRRSQRKRFLAAAKQQIGIVDYGLRAAIFLGVSFLCSHYLTTLTRTTQLDFWLATSLELTN